MSVPWRRVLRLKLRFLSESSVTPRRRFVFAMLTVLAVVYTSWNDFDASGEHKIGLWGLVALAALSLAAAYASTAVLGRVSLRSQLDAERFRRNLNVLLRSARPIPQRRDTLPLSDFTGRASELLRWRQAHDQLRAMRAAGAKRPRRRPAPARPGRARARPEATRIEGDVQRQSPVILAMHGPPGVGKSALAHALCRELAKQYPHGLLVANFGTSGTARGPADVTRDLLLQLGWPEWDMPNETEDRVATLRSMTRNRRLLFLFDAVRDHDQLNQVLPSDPECTVIITSRRELGSSLGLPRRAPVGAMSLHDALEMLTAVSGVDWTYDVETAVELVELCGRAPLALRVVAERIRDGQGMRAVATLMRPAGSRLAMLTYGGRSVGARIESEFQRLDRTQQQALILLATLEAESFVPWVLRPMMRLAKGESKALVTDLAAAQFVEQDGEDQTGQPRYRIHALMRLYALQRHRQGDTAGLSKAEIEEAKARLDRAYLDLVDDVLYEYDRTRSATYRLIRQGRSREGRSEQSDIAPKIAACLDEIVRREYLNLVRLIHNADQGTYAQMIWRVAALLDGRTPAFPPGARTAEAQRIYIIEAFNMGVSAAQDCRNELAKVYVLLAKAQFLIAVDHYQHADAALAEAATVIAAMDRAETPPARLRLARVRAWREIEVGRFSSAVEELGRADAHLGELSPTGWWAPHAQIDTQLVVRLNQDLHRSEERQPEPGLPDGRLTGPSDSTDIVALHERLAAAEAARRRGHWDDAAAILRGLLRSDGDARGHTSVHYRLAVLQIEHALQLRLTRRRGRRANDHRGEVAREAVQHAAACIYTFGTIGDRVGQLRGRALLTRALIQAGNLPGATQLDLELKSDIEILGDGGAPEVGSSIYVETLRAQYHLAHAEVELIHGRIESGWQSLVEAEQAFRRLGDWSSHADAWRLLHEVYIRNPDNRRDIEQLDEDG